MSGRALLLDRELFLHGTQSKKFSVQEQSPGLACFYAPLDVISVITEIREITDEDDACR